MYQGLNRQRFFIPLPDGKTQLALHQFYPNNLVPKELTPLILIPGNMENSRIYFSENLKGFAPFMASHGYCVYCLDTRGKGDSIPKTSAHFDYQQLDIIKDLNVVYHFISSLHQQKQIWGSHSWGGVILNCWLIRNPLMANNIKRLIHFGVKRSISIRSIKKFLMIDLGMKNVLMWQSMLTGHVAPKFFGNEAESKSYLKDINQWIDPSKFRDPSDRFDYYENSKKVKWPKSLYLVGEADLVLGHIKDVKSFIEECHIENSIILKLGKSNGFAKDYNHIDMLTDKMATHEHFKSILDFIN